MLAKKTLFIALFVVITSSFTWSDWEDRKGPPPTVYLSQLLENPESWLDIPVKIPLRFSDIRQIYTPFLPVLIVIIFLTFLRGISTLLSGKKKVFLMIIHFFMLQKMQKNSKLF